MVGGMRARMWRHDTQLRSPVTSAFQVHATRTHLFLEVEFDGVRGLGEISPQPVTLNGDPGYDEVVVELEHFTLRQFIEAAKREGTVPQWTRVTHFAGSRRASSFACALLEMALLDAYLRARRETIEDRFPVRHETPTQVTVSLLDDNPWVASEGAVQVRAKVSPAAMSEEKWRRLEQLGMPVLLDFNCSAGTTQDVVTTVTAAQSHVEVAAVEQPFAPGNVVEHARLARMLDVPVSLDEGVRHRRDLDQIVRYGAARIVCVKPARVGGYAQARTMIEQGQQLGLEVYVGGFFETPLARRANRALARHYVTLASDIADSDLETGEVLVGDPWGCGFLPGDLLESSSPLLNRRW